jgi:hypothetical protein
MTLIHEDGKTMGKVDPRRIYWSRPTDKGCVIKVHGVAEPIHLCQTQEQLLQDARAYLSYNPVQRSMKAMPGSLAEKLNAAAKKHGEPGLYIPFPDAPKEVATHATEGIFVTKGEMKAFRGNAEKAAAYKPRVAQEQEQDIVREELEQAEEKA